MFANHFFIQVAGVLLGLSSLFLLMSCSSQTLWIALIFWALISGLGVAVGYHRILTHGAMKLPKWLEYSIAFLGALGFQGSALVWVAVHREHHRHADYPSDPHSPYKGKWHAFMGWIGYTNANPFYAPELTKGFHRFIYDWYELILIYWVIALTIIDIRLMLAYFVAVLLSLLQENMVNLLCHLPSRSQGYRNFDTPDETCNVVWLAWLSWGQGWHNNHHEKPGKFNFAHYWFEFDPAMVFYPVLKWFSKK